MDWMEEPRSNPFPIRTGVMCAHAWRDFERAPRDWYITAFTWGGDGEKMVVGHNLFVSGVCNEAARVVVVPERRFRAMQDVIDAVRGSIAAEKTLRDLFERFGQL